MDQETAAAATTAAVIAVIAVITFQYHGMISMLPSHWSVRRSTAGLATLDLQSQARLAINEVS